MFSSSLHREQTAHEYSGWQLTGASLMGQSHCSPIFSPPCSCTYRKFLVGPECLLEILCLPVYPATPDLSIDIVFYRKVLWVCAVATWVLDWWSTWDVCILAKLTVFMLHCFWQTCGEQCLILVDCFWQNGIWSKNLKQISHCFTFEHLL